MSENSEKNLQEMFDGNVSVDDEQLNSIAEDDSLLDSNGDIVSGQRSPPPGRYNQKRRHDNQNRRSRQQQSRTSRASKGKQPAHEPKFQARRGAPERSPFRKRPRRTASDRDDISRMKDKIESSEQSVIKLKRHIENGTCPPDLFYDAKANIFPDEDFRSDIKAIQKEAEQKFLGALIKFHNCRIDRNQARHCEKPNLVIRIHQLKQAKVNLTHVTFQKV